MLRDTIFAASVGLALVILGVTMEPAEVPPNFVAERLAILEADTALHRYAGRVGWGTGVGENGSELEWLAHTYPDGRLKLEFSRTLSSACVDRLLEVRADQPWLISVGPSYTWIDTSASWLETCWREHDEKLVRCTPAELVRSVTAQLESTGCFSGLTPHFLERRMPGV